MQKTEEKIVVFPVGAPLSGKGEVGRLLSTERGFEHVSTSSILCGSRYDVAALIRKGEVVGDEIMLSLLKPVLAAGGKRLYIDSLRSAWQVQWAMEALRGARFYTIHFLVDEEEIACRLANARNTERGQREDDRSLKVRLRKYEEYFAEMIPTLRRKTVCAELNCNRPFRDIAEDLRSFCDHHRISEAYSPVFAGALEVSG